MFIKAALALDAGTGDGSSVSLRTSRRSYQPVRRHSREAGRCEAVFWRKTDRQEVRKIVLAARRYDLASRQPGARNGALGHVAIEILELLANIIEFRTGRLEPSLDYLAAKLKRSKDAVVRALQALRLHGFLDWLRRFEPTGNTGRGPRVRQVSNAYRLSLPRKAAALIGRWFGRPLEPADALHAREQREAEIEAYRDSLSLAELPLFDVEDEGLAAALSRLGAAMESREKLRKERESAQQSESPSTNII